MSGVFSALVPFISSNIIMFWMQNNTMLGSTFMQLVAWVGRKEAPQVYFCSEFCSQALNLIFWY